MKHLIMVMKLIIAKKKIKMNLENVNLTQKDVVHLTVIVIAKVMANLLLLMDVKVVQVVVTHLLPIQIHQVLMIAVPVQVVILIPVQVKMKVKKKKSSKRIIKKKS